MKRTIRFILYSALLLVEFLVGLMFMLLLWSNTFHIACAVTVGIWTVMMAWQIVLLKKAPDAARRHKIKRNIAFVMAIPTVAFIGMVIWFIIGFMLVT